MNRAKLLATLLQIKTLTHEAMKEVEIGPRGGKSNAVTSAQPKPPVTAAHLSFSTNVLAFMNKHARGLKGPQKFTLLLARLAKGKTSQQVPRTQLKSHWNKMKVVLGGKFNPAHANRAKAKGWVDSPKHGLYTLSISWKDGLKNNG